MGGFLPCMRLITSHFISVIFYVIPGSTHRQPSQYFLFSRQNQVFNQENDGSNFLLKKSPRVQFSNIEKQYWAFLYFPPELNNAGAGQTPHIVNIYWVIETDEELGTQTLSKVMHGISHVTFPPRHKHTQDIWNMCN